MLWQLETEYRKYATETDMSDVYRHLCANERGSPDNILENVKRTLGGYPTVLQQKLSVKVQKERLQLTRYTYALWFNLLHLVQPHPKKIHAERMNNALHNSNKIQYVFELVKYDLLSLSSLY